jgi:hypothetical protein
MESPTTTTSGLLTAEEASHPGKHAAAAKSQSPADPARHDRARRRRPTSSCLFAEFDRVDLFTVSGAGYPLSRHMSTAGAPSPLAIRDSRAAIFGPGPSGSYAITDDALVWLRRLLATTVQSDRQAGYPSLLPGRSARVSSLEGAGEADPNSSTHSPSGRPLCVTKNRLRPEQSP